VKPPSKDQPACTRFSATSLHTWGDPSCGGPRSTQAVHFVRRRVTYLRFRVQRDGPRPSSMMTAIDRQRIVSIACEPIVASQFRTRGP